MENKIDNPWYYYVSDELVKKKKPCLTGDLIHIKNFSGCYKVHATSIRSFTVVKNRREIKFTWDRFQCLKGHGDSEETFLKRELRSLIDTINLNVTGQILMTEVLKSELKNLRKTFI